MIIRKHPSRHSVSTVHNIALMRMRAWGGIFLVACLLATPAFAERRVVYITGNELHEMCQLEPVMCEGYIMGVADALEGTAWPAIRSCRPNTVVAQQVVDLSIKALAEKPAERHRPAFDLIADEIVELWPC